MNNNIIQLLLWRYLFRNNFFQYPSLIVESQCNKGEDGNECEIIKQYSSSIKKLLNFPFVFKNKFDIEVYYRLNHFYNPYNIIDIEKTILDFSYIQGEKFYGDYIILNNGTNFIVSIKMNEKYLKNQDKQYIKRISTEEEIKIENALAQFLPIINPEVFFVWNIFKIFNKKVFEIENIENYDKLLQYVKENISYGQILLKILDIVFYDYYLQEDIYFDFFISQLIQFIPSIYVTVEGKDFDKIRNDILTNSFNDFKKYFIMTIREDIEKWFILNSREDGFLDFLKWIKNFLRSEIMADNIINNNMSYDEFKKSNRIRFFDIIMDCIINKKFDTDDMIKFTLFDIMEIFINETINDLNNEAYNASINSILINNDKFIENNPFFSLFYCSFRSLFDHINVQTIENNNGSIITNYYHTNPYMSLNFDIDKYMNNLDVNNNNDDINKRIHIENKGNNISQLVNIDNIDIEQLFKYPCQVILTENVNGTLIDILNKLLTFDLGKIEEIESLYFQILYALLYFNQSFEKSKINNTSSYQVMYKNVPETELFFKIRNDDNDNINSTDDFTYYRIPLFGYIIKIVSMEKSIIYYNYGENLSSPPDYILNRRINGDLNRNDDINKLLFDINYILLQWINNIDTDKLNIYNIEIMNNINRVRLMTSQCIKNHLDYIKLYKESDSNYIREYTNNQCTSYLPNSDNEKLCLYNYNTYIQSILRSCNYDNDCYIETQGKLFTKSDDLCNVDFEIDNNIFKLFKNFIINDREYIKELELMNNFGTIKIYEF